MPSIAERQRLKQTRGMPYLLEDFRQKYALTEAEASRLYNKFGPYSSELDALMAAKGAPRLKQVNQ